MCVTHRPQLRTPPPLTTEGKPLEAPAEKSFLQKYWIYLVVGLLALGASSCSFLICLLLFEVSMFPNIPFIQTRPSLLESVQSYRASSLLYLVLRVACPAYALIFEFIYTLQLRRRVSPSRAASLGLCTLWSFSISRPLHF